MKGSSMLVVTRKIGQRVIINDTIKVEVIRGRYDDTIKLGIEAPQDVEIFREELYDRIQEKKRHDNYNRDPSSNDVGDGK